MNGLLDAGLGLLALVVMVGLLLGVLLLQLQTEGRAVRLRPWVLWMLGVAGALAVAMVLVGVVVGVWL